MKRVRFKIITDKKYKKESGGWFFVPRAILVDEEQEKTIVERLKRDEIVVKGFFPNDTMIKKEDELIDPFLNAEKYEINQSLVKWFDTLKSHKIISSENSFFNEEQTRQLFNLVCHCSKFIKDNQNKPIHLKNQLIDLIKGFDEIPIWGLFFQILTLQGICTMFESLTICQGEKGFDEAQSLYNWVVRALIEKLVFFSNCYFTGKDLKMIAPLCEYLCTTKAGQIVQKDIIDRYYTDPKEKTSSVAIESPQKAIENEYTLPTINNTDEERKVFKKAIGAGLMEICGQGYKWKRSNVLLAYMCGRLYCGDKIAVDDTTKQLMYKKGIGSFHETSINKLFDVKNIGQSRRQIKYTPKGYEDIDKLF